MCQFNGQASHVKLLLFGYVTFLFYLTINNALLGRFIQDSL